MSNQIKNINIYSIYVQTLCHYAQDYTYCDNVQNPEEDVQQSLCPKNLITLVRCRKPGLNYKVAAYLWKQAMRDVPAFL